jgi:prepilin-type N-terminal cleavage/methylation domain-containing protein
LVIYMSARKRLARENGFTLIEVLVTMTILVVGMGGALSLIDGAAKRTATTKQREGATALARQIVEGARSVPYSQLTPAGVVAALQAQAGLDDSDASAGWQVKRRETVYTLTATTCSMDDPQDGIGDHSQGTGSYCSTAAQTTPPDRSPDDYKRVAVDVTWKDRTTQRSIRQTTVIANESSTSGPRITSFTRSPSSDPMTSPAQTSIDFTATTDRPAAAVKYQVDGVAKKTAAPSGLTSSFNWQIGGGTEARVPDGTYLVTATAFDSQGQPGVARSLTVRLNRDAPKAVQGVVGGWNATRGVSEVAWELNNESDILGYRVYVSADGGPRDLVPGCDLGATATRCVDSSPKEGALSYYVVALDSDGTSTREGTLSAPLAVTRTENRPNPPGALTYNVDGGDVRLTWTTPKDVTPAYAGSEVAFFWIYRDGDLVGKRLDFTGSGTDTTFTDRGAAGKSHTYWVSAVDRNWSESASTGPVGP